MEEKKFEELRNQFAFLKQQLEKQEIVSDRLLRKAMEGKTLDISYTKKTVYSAAIFCLILYPFTYITHMWNLSFALATCAMVIFCAVCTYYIHRPVERLDFMRDDFTTVARVMARFKKQYNDWLHYVTPILLIPWLSWACYDFAWVHGPKRINPWLLALPLIFGGIIGAIIGYRNHRKAVNAAQDILDEIERDNIQ
jgi:hypothetical protein